MSSNLNLEQADEGIWRRKAILRSEDLARKPPHKRLELGGSRALERVLMQSDQTEKTWW
jgi:hypothetical protein